MVRFGAGDDDGCCARIQDKIVAEFQAMVARLNGIFDEKAALLASLGQPHEAGPANLVRASCATHGNATCVARCCLLGSEWQLS